MAIMNPEHTIMWPETWEELLHYLTQLHPDAKHLKFCVFMTQLGVKHVYNQLSYQALIPAEKIYNGNIRVFSVFLWQVILPQDKTLYLSSHLHLTELSQVP
jgi:hypothetical protein